MTSISQRSYLLLAQALGQFIAGSLWLAIWPLTLIGQARSEAEILKSIALGQLCWIGPESGDEKGLISSYRLHIRMAMLQDDEQALNNHDAYARGWHFDFALLLRYGWSLLIGKKATQTESRWPLLGLWLDNLRHVQITDQLKQWRNQPHQRRIAFVNPHCANLASKDPLYRGVLNSSDLLLPDGSGVLLASRILKTPLQENTNGTDLFPILCHEWQQTGARLYLLGGRHGVAEQVAQHLLNKYPGLYIAGTHHGYSSEEDTPALINEIRESKADVLVVAMGVPLQDVWIAKHQRATGAPLALGVGGLFDFLSGRIPRAPIWLRELGLEWCWRLLQEPRRMWQRYLVGNFTFITRVMRQKLSRNTSLLGSPINQACKADERRQAVLLTDYSLWQGKDGVDMLLSPLIGHSQLELSIIRLVEHGVQLVHLFADEGYSAIAAQLGNGERWGIEIRYYLSGQQLQTRRRLASLALPEYVFLVAPGCLPNTTLSTDAESQWLLEQGEWSGWAYMKSKRLKLVLGRTALPLPAGTQSFSGLPLRNAQELSNALPILLQTAPHYLADYREVKHQVWLAPGVIYEKDVILEGPLLIGHNTLIRQGCHIGPNVVIGHDCILEKQVDIHNSLVKPASYIAEQMSIAHSIVGNRQLHLVRDNTVLHFDAQECLIDDMSQSPSLAKLSERLQAMLALAWLGIQRQQLDPARWQNTANRLRDVIAGNCHLIGLPCVPNQQRHSIEHKNFRLGALRLSELQPHTFPAEGLSQAEQDWLTDLYGAAMPQSLTWAQLQNLAHKLKRKHADFAI